MATISLKIDTDNIDFSAPLTEEEEKNMAMDDRIDDYIFGRMSIEEENIFLSDCKKDPELKHRAYMTALMVKGIKNISK